MKSGSEKAVGIDGHRRTDPVMQPVARLDLYEGEFWESDTHRTYRVEARMRHIATGEPIRVHCTSFTYPAWCDNGHVVIGKARARREAVTRAFPTSTVTPTPEEAP